MTNTLWVPPPPQLETPEDMKPSEQEKLLKSEFPSFTEGTTAEIDAVTEAVFRYASVAIDYWKNQKLLALNNIRRTVRDAKTATRNGMPVCSRRIFEVPEKVIPKYVADGFWPNSTGTR